MGALAGIVLEKAVEATLVLMARAAAAVAGGAVVADIIRDRIDQVDKAK